MVVAAAIVAVVVVRTIILRMLRVSGVCSQRVGFRSSAFAEWQLGLGYLGHIRNVFAVKSHPPCSLLKGSLDSFFHY